MEVEKPDLRHVQRCCLPLAAVVARDFTLHPIQSKSGRIACLVTPLRQQGGKDRMKPAISPFVFSSCSKETGLTSPPANAGSKMEKLAIRHGTDDPCTSCRIPVSQASQE
eukprot:1160563-Pelagomonas_calceolata.AAC.8